MFDCYHVQILEGDLTRRLSANPDITGHIQFAGVLTADLTVARSIIGMFAHIGALGYDALLAAVQTRERRHRCQSGWMSTLG